ncbi:MAG: translation elongation factor Ts [Anaerolineales bacterium]|nr:translation elongation factor Ts [Anaerolineales bacterium]
MAIDVKMIKELRELTGAGVLDVKKALESTGGDFEQAMVQLREKGLARAAKRSDREMTEGRVEGRFEDNKIGLMVEINCETDFVAMNEQFIDISTRVADHLFANSTEGQLLEELVNLPFADTPDKTPKILLEDLVSTTGENMAISRYIRYELGDRPGRIEVYIHPGNRVVVMLELNSETQKVADSDAFAGFAHELALHIAAQAPLCLNRNEVPEALLQAEKEIYKKQALETGKPENIIDRIVEGRVTKYFQEVVLSEQAFVKDDKVTIGQLLKQKKAELGETIIVSRFVRYELGETHN